jgi:RNA polymerase-associated protein RTF1
MQMSEIEREEIITQRVEEKQRIQDKLTIAQMVKEQRGGEADSVSKAAKRSHTSSLFPMDIPDIGQTGQHAVRGATKEKSRKLDELKARRKAKDEKKRVGDIPTFDYQCSLQLVEQEYLSKT